MGESACWNDWRAFLSEIRIALRGTYRKHVDFIVLQTNKKWLEEINDGNIPTILWRNISTMADSGHGYIRPTKKRNRPSRRHMLSCPMVFPVAQFWFCCQVGNSPTCWTCHQPTIIAQQYKGVCLKNWRISICHSGIGNVRVWPFLQHTQISLQFVGLLPYNDIPHCIPITFWQCNIAMEMDHV